MENVKIATSKLQLVIQYEGHPLIRLLLIVILLGNTLGCGQSSYTAPASFGKITFNVFWGQQTSGKRVGLELGGMPTEVITVRAIISGPAMTTMQNDFPAADHQGSLVDAVSAGINRTLTLQGLDAGGQAVFSGSVSGIIVTDGGTTDAGTVLTPCVRIVVAPLPIFCVNLGASDKGVL